MQELKKEGKKFKLSSHEVITKHTLLNMRDIPDIPFADKPGRSG